MIKPRDLIKSLGLPAANAKNMILWKVPDELRFGPIPKKIYCHQLLVDMLTRAFRLIISRGLQDDLKTWDGCFNDRPMRGYEDEFKALLLTNPEEAYALYASIHSWGLAIDINAFENKMFQNPKMSPALVKCFTDVGFEWGGAWKTRVDGMHFQVASL